MRAAFIVQLSHERRIPPSRAWSRTDLVKPRKCESWTRGATWLVRGGDLSAIYGVTWFFAYVRPSSWGGAQQFP
jgi:hypothetical protein